MTIDPSTQPHNNNISWELNLIIVTYFYKGIIAASHELPTEKLEKLAFFTSFKKYDTKKGDLSLRKESRFGHGRPASFEAFKMRTDSFLRATA